MKQLTLTLLYLLFISWNLQAQSSSPGSNELDHGSREKAPFVHLKRTADVIKLDGLVNEAAWFKGVPAKQFWEYFPYDSLHAQSQTEIYMTYDDNYLYVGVKCFSIGDNYVTPSLRRDYGFSGSDNVSLLFDTYNDKTNAFLFGLNPFGVRREALISGGGKQRQDYSGSWDNKWYGEAKILGNHWEAEFAIPFKTLRFKEGSTNWRFNCYRNDTQTNEMTTWINIPKNQIIMDLSYMGDMVWEEPLKKPGKNISIIPFMSSASVRDFQNENEHSPNYDFQLGGDAKIAVTSGLNLDLTVNPDFSQVEVDQQVTNLSRFEIFFPERRQFFLENADLFGGFGQRRVNPFFSRRIGVAVDTSTGQNIQNTILGGARLSGKINDNLRIGLMNMQTAKDGSAGLPSFNYSVLALQQKVFDHSALSFLFVNKQAVNSEENSDLFNSYNRVAGLEYRLASADNRWTGKTFVYRAFTTENKNQKFSQGLELQYTRRKYRFEWRHTYVGNGFDAEVGFVPRKDFVQMGPEGQLFFYPKKGKINRHGPGFRYRLTLKVGEEDNEFRSNFGRSDQFFQLFWDFRFQDNARARITLQNNYIFLFNDFDPTRKQADSVFLAAGTDYHYTSLNGFYSSDRRKKFFFNINPNVGQFFNGYRLGMQGSFTYRYQPFGSIAVSYNYNYIKLDDPFKSASIILVGPRMDLTFSKKLFLTTFIQYNNQIDNININTRLQWRFKPVSDFFIVYTDNYFPDGLKAKNRAIVAKVTYWLNL